MGFKAFDGKGPSRKNCISDATKTPPKATRKTRVVRDSNTSLNPSKRFSTLPPSDTSPAARDCSSPHLTAAGQATIIRDTA